MIRRHSTGLWFHDGGPPTANTVEVDYAHVRVDVYAAYIMDDYGTLVELTFDQFTTAWDSYITR